MHQRYWWSSFFCGSMGIVLIAIAVVALAPKVAFAHGKEPMCLDGCGSSCNGTMAPCGEEKVCTGQCPGACKCTGNDALCWCDF